MGKIPLPTIGSNVEFNLPAHLSTPEISRTKGKVMSVDAVRDEKGRVLDHIIRVQAPDGMGTNRVFHLELRNVKEAPDEAA